MAQLTCVLSPKALLVRQRAQATDLLVSPAIASRLAVSRVRDRTGFVANPPWSHGDGPPSRVLTMLSLRAEADCDDRVHDRCREMLMAGDV